MKRIVLCLLVLMTMISAFAGITYYGEVEDDMYLIICGDSYIYAIEPTLGSRLGVFIDFVESNGNRIPRIELLLVDWRNEAIIKNNKNLSIDIYEGDMLSNLGVSTAYILSSSRIPLDIDTAISSRKPGSPLAIMQNTNSITLLFIDDSADAFKRMILNDRFSITIWYEQELYPFEFEISDTILRDFVGYLL